MVLPPRKQPAEAAQAAVRSTANFNWTFIALLALVVCGVYVPNIKKKNWNGIAAALALYGVHWFYEIMNAVICPLPAMRCGRCHRKVPHGSS